MPTDSNIFEKKQSPLTVVKTLSLLWKWKFLIVLLAIVCSIILPLTVYKESTHYKKYQITIKYTLKEPSLKSVNFDLFPNTIPSVVLAKICKVPLVYDSLLTIENEDFLHQIKLFLDVNNATARARFDGDSSAIFIYINAVKAVSNNNDTKSKEPIQPGKNKASFSFLSKVSKLSENICNTIEKDPLFVDSAKRSLELSNKIVKELDDYYKVVLDVFKNSSTTNDYFSIFYQYVNVNILLNKYINDRSRLVTSFSLTYTPPSKGQNVYILIAIGSFLGLALSIIFIFLYETIFSNPSQEN